MINFLDNFVFLSYINYSLCVSFSNIYICAPLVCHVNYSSVVKMRQVSQAGHNTGIGNFKVVSFFCQ